ncbi:MAG: DUF1501 domain-containing protein [Planctomycetes bacterium]|nr:DUF1501 domain-containing protein [Planctomycetota bacterium]
MTLVPVNPVTSRRHFLQAAGCGFGAIALAALQAERAAANPLAPRAPHFTPRARRVIFLFMQGGPSHMDLFDYKPRLARSHGQPLPFTLPAVEQTVGMNNTRLLGPVAGIRPHGQSGLLVSDLLPNLARHADDLCVLRGMVADSPNHPTAINFLHTGALNDLRPSLGAWLAYGLGTENRNLPGYITILPGEGERNYNSAFLPAIYQGTPIQDVGGSRPPIRHLSDAGTSPNVQRRRLDLIQAMNRRHLERLRADQQMEGVIESFELAFRMQAEAPRLVDLTGETRRTLDLYGIGREPTDQFGRQCLLARRLAEAGVRFIQVTLNGWDHHGSIRSAIPVSCARADRPIAGLLADLKARGLLHDTLVVWAGEFGRTPHSQDLTMGQAPLSEFGREHNPHGFTIWLAGGGVKGGFTHGATDDFGYRAVTGRVHMHDLHATILHLLGLNHERLTFRVAGRDFRLTDVHGEVVREIMA